MSDYISESEALADWEDDNCIVDEDEFYDNDWSMSFRRSHYIGRKSGLSKSIESKRSSNLEAKVGTDCKCPICGKTFTKKSYQQKFCSSRCRLRYNNKRKIYVWI